MSYFRGKKVLVSAGPTYEKIDDVRFIGNYSSGKMGFALAEVVSELGAFVTLVTGPTMLSCNSEIERIDVISAEDMHREIIKVSDKQDIIIMAAAVADYTPENKVTGKIKKSGIHISLNLVRTKDILKELGDRKPDKQLLVGFALESEYLVEYAQSKLEQKNCNIIIANQANTKDSGFNKDVNTITILDDRQNIVDIPTASKLEIAKSILRYISEYAVQQ